MPRGTPVEDVPCDNMFYVLYRLFKTEDHNKRRRRSKKSLSLPLAFRRYPEEASDRRHSWCPGIEPDEQWRRRSVSDASTQTSSTLSSPFSSLKRWRSWTLDTDKSGQRSPKKQAASAFFYRPPVYKSDSSDYDDYLDTSNLRALSFDSVDTPSKKKPPDKKQASPQPDKRLDQGIQGSPPKKELPKVPGSEVKKKETVAFLETPKCGSLTKKVSIQVADDDEFISIPAPKNPEAGDKPIKSIVRRPQNFGPGPSTSLKETHIGTRAPSTRTSVSSDQSKFRANNELRSPPTPDSHPSYPGLLKRTDSELSFREYEARFWREPPSQMFEIMNSVEEHERKIIIEFCHLLEKSKQLFNGLRELPQYGHKQWHSYFGRTFDVYTKLWKYQQTNRAILDCKYGLKRWQIGEIASKIGQLYYHFYLRTSETAYLNEAFSFYSAIRGRCYYTKASKEDKCELMVKKLRYYARFIVVCLLLRKNKLCRELIKELDRQIIDYGNTYDPDDQMEWIVVVDEIKAFIQAEPVITVLHPDNYPIVLSHRLNPMNIPPVERLSHMTLSLQEVVIVGSSNQVKFSEMTMDMFRMLHTLEREPSENPQSLFDESPRPRFANMPIAPHSRGYSQVIGPRRILLCNPHKYLLFKPSPAQVLVYLSSGCHDLPPNGALLLYISADGHVVPQTKRDSEEVCYESGGLITTSRNDIYRDSTRAQDPKAGPSTPKYKEVQCLYPGDLLPFTRRPLFIIIDSDNSAVFQNMPRHFAQPLMILMSPVELPERLQDRKHQGNLFTLFLHAPLAAICLITDIINLSLSHWEKAMGIIDSFMVEASTIMTRSKVDPSFIAFMGDDFFRLMLLRFVFCEVTIRRHRAFRSRNHHARSLPSLPEEFFDNPTLNHIIMELATHLQVRGLFHDPSSAGPSSSKE